MAKTSILDSATRGREAAREIWGRGLAAAIDDPLDPEFAIAAVTEFARLQQEHTPGIYRDVLAGAEINAEQVNVQPFHGVVEVLQNADDAHAHELRIAVRSRSNGRELLFAHDGDAIRLPELVAMALSFVSTKREDVTSKGRFGIGLKTLKRLGNTLSVHCGPYHAGIAEHQIAPVPPAEAINGFYRPDSGETLIGLRLRSDFEVDDFKAWLAIWDASSLLFLDSVRALRFINLRTGKPLIELQLDERPGRTYQLGVGRELLTCTETILEAKTPHRVWHRYMVERPVAPSAPKRKYKATGTTTPLSVAIPEDTEASGRLFAGLPLETALHAPLSLNAQFNVDLARTMAEPRDPWNNWLLDRCMEFVAAVGIRRFDEPARGWIAVPLMAEVERIVDAWLRDRVLVGVRAIHSRIARSATINIAGHHCKLDQLVYEAHPLERLLDPGDLSRLYPELTPIPRAVRDKSDRWRSVLGELAQSTEVSVADAMRLLDDDTLNQRPVSWFIRFARAAIAADEGESLLWRRSIVLANGERIVPPAAHVEAEVLVRASRPDSLAACFGLARVIHPAFLTDNPEATAVRRFLERNDILVDEIGDEPALRALATRGANGAEPMTLRDNELIALRKALALLDEPDQELGQGIGRAIGVRGFRWERGNRIPITVAPAAAYLSGKLDDRPENWSKAAGSTESIAWIDTKYAEILKRPSPDHRGPSAAGFFRMLGAEVAPRLVAPTDLDERRGEKASPIRFDALMPVQLEALAAARANRSTHLKDDLVSPDLTSVVRNISSERSRSRRRERARALLKILDREWSRLYANHATATAVVSSRTWLSTATLPATWLAIAIDTPWLTNIAGLASAPRKLAVRTKSTEALFGRTAPIYCSEIGTDLSTSAAVRGLQLMTDPCVSEVVEQLAALRALGGAVNAAEVGLRYAILASSVSDGAQSLESAVGDLTVRQLRARFGTDPRKPGLILVEGNWLAPPEVLRGKPIFGGRRAFVPERSHADRLWRVLGVRTPTIADCIDVLKEIAHSSPDDEAEQILLDTYVYLEERLGSATRAQQRALADVPLWSGAKWIRRRPIYSAEPDDLAQALSQKLPIWRTPVPTRTTRRLCDALGVTPLDDRSFTVRIAEAERLAGEGVRDAFVAAVANLREWLALHDREIYEAATHMGWERLGAASIAWVPNLHVELLLAGRALIRVMARSHVSREPLQFAFADLEDIGAEEHGGRLIASLFDDYDQDKIALAWVSSWSRALRGDRSSHLRLAEERDDIDPLDALFEQAATSAGLRRGATSVNQHGSSPTVATSRLAPEVVRRLKSPEDIEVVVSVSRPDGPGPASTSRAARGLRVDDQLGRSIDAMSRPTARSAPQAYTPQQQEHLALLKLQQAINGELSDLKDYRHLQGFGADALDRLKRAFEIKSFATTMPDRVTLTAAEFARAVMDGPNYHLAIIAGLEKDYQTVVRIIADPVRELVVQKSSSVVLSGILSARKPIDVRFG